MFASVFAFARSLAAADVIEEAVAQSGQGSEPSAHGKVLVTAHFRPSKKGAGSGPAAAASSQSTLGASFLAVGSSSALDAAGQQPDDDGEDQGSSDEVETTAGEDSEEQHKDSPAAAADPPLAPASDAAALFYASSMLSGPQRRAADKAAQALAGLQQQQGQQGPPVPPLEDADEVRSVVNMHVGPNKIRLTSSGEVRAFFAQQLLDQRNEYEQRLREMKSQHQADLAAKETELAQLDGYASGSSDPTVASTHSHLTSDFILRKTPQDMATRASKLATAEKDIITQGALLESTRKRLTIARFEKDVLAAQVDQDKVFAQTKKMADEARRKHKENKAAEHTGQLATRISTEEQLLKARTVEPDVKLTTRANDKKQPVAAAAASQTAAQLGSPPGAKRRTSARLASPDPK